MEQEIEQESPVKDQQILELPEKSSADSTPYTNKSLSPNFSNNSSPKTYGIQNGRANSRKVPREHLRRKRSCSEEISPKLTDQIYHRIDKYLDREGLFILSPSPILKPRHIEPCVLKPLINIQKIVCFESEPSTKEEEGEEEPEISRIARPSFLVKRNQSTCSNSPISNGTSCTMLNLHTTHWSNFCTGRNSMPNHTNIIKLEQNSSNNE